MGAGPDDQDATVRKQSLRRHVITVATPVITVVQVSDTGESTDRRIIDLRLASHERIVAIRGEAAGAAGDQDFAVGEAYRRVTNAGRGHTASRGKGSRGRIVKLRAGQRASPSLRR